MPRLSAQCTSEVAGALPPSARPKLVVLLVVDQMRGDYVDSLRGNGPVD